MDQLTPGEQLRIWRARSNLRLDDAAKLIGCSAQTLSRIERHTRKPTLEVGLAIEAQAGIPAISWVKTDTGPQPAEPTGDDDDRDTETAS